MNIELYMKSKDELKHQVECFGIRAISRRTGISVNTIYSILDESKETRIQERTIKKLVNWYLIEAG